MSEIKSVEELTEAQKIAILKAIKVAKVDKEKIDKVILGDKFINIITRK